MFDRDDWKDGWRIYLYIQGRMTMVAGAVVIGYGVYDLVTGKSAGGTMKLIGSGIVLIAMGYWYGPGPGADR